MPGLVGGLPAAPSSAQVLLICQTSLTFSRPARHSLCGSSPGCASDLGEARGIMMLADGPSWGEVPVQCRGCWM